MQHPRDLARTSIPNLRKPAAEDGPAIWDLVRACKPLDENSIYCNLLQCDHFADTCVVAELDGEIVGWISGYLTPNADDTLFVWQVAVSERARGLGLGVLMLQSLLNRDACDDVQRLQTTITADNAASWGMFRKFARIQGGTLDSEPHFLQSQHFEDRQKTENMVTIDLASERMERAA